MVRVKLPISLVNKMKLFLLDFLSYSFSSTIEVNYELLNENGSEDKKDYQMFVEFVTLGT